MTTYNKYSFCLYFDENNNEPGNTDPGTQQTDPGTTTPPAGADDRRYSDADLDRIIGERLRKWEKQKQKAVDEAKRLAEMTAQERAEHERDELQKELNELKAATARADMEKTARQMLNADGVTVPDVLVACLVRDDADATAEAVKNFATAYKAAIQAGIRAELAGKTPPAGQGAGTLTKADIMREKDPVKRQKLIRENMKLFK